MPPIYLDTNATTPVDAAVVDAIVPILRDTFGNPSSTHDTVMIIAATPAGF